LNGIGWCEISGQFSNANEIHGSDEVNKSLRNAYERTDLADWL
jgi:hypothetical protein